MIATFELPTVLKNNLMAYVKAHTQGLNPYHDAQAPQAALAIAKHLYTQVANDGSSPMRALQQHIDAASHDQANLGATLLRNCFVEPVEELVPPCDSRGFDYGRCASDRMKEGFTAEWVSWAIGKLFNCENVIHPCEHGGNNRFHMVSPVPNADHSLRRMGASTGGGKFHLHNDASVYVDPMTEPELLAQLDEYGTDLQQVSHELGRDKKVVLAEMTCGRYMRSDFTMLSGVVNIHTKTHISTPAMLHQHLLSEGYRQADFETLASLPIAHLAGPADGDISNFVGSVRPPITLSDAGIIESTCLNLADNRMRYVGTVPAEKALFERFVSDARRVPVIEVLIRPGDVLMFPNAAFAQQKNVMHGRAELTEEDYQIEVAPGKFMRRVHCRQYLNSRARDQQASILSGWE